MWRHRLLSVTCPLTLAEVQVGIATVMGHTSMDVLTRDKSLSTLKEFK